MSLCSLFSHHGLLRHWSDLFRQSFTLHEPNTQRYWQPYSSQWHTWGQKTMLLALYRSGTFWTQFRVIQLSLKNYFNRLMPWQSPHLHFQTWTLSCMAQNFVSSFGSWNLLANLTKRRCSPQDIPSFASSLRTIKDNSVFLTLISMMTTCSCFER